MRTGKNETAGIPRRKFLQISATTAGTLGTVAIAPSAQSAGIFGSDSSRPRARSANARPFNSEYGGEFLNRVAFPMGGMGAGMICLEGTGALSHFSLRHRPEVYNEPVTFAAVSIKGGKGKVARV